MCFIGGLTWADTPAEENTNNVAVTIGKHLALGAAGEKLPASFGVGLDWGAPKFGDMKPVCQLLFDAGFIELATAPRDEKKRTPDDAPCREVSVHVAGHARYVMECFCESPFADDKHTQRFRRLHAALRKVALDVPENPKAKQAANGQWRRYSEWGAGARRRAECDRIDLIVPAVRGRLGDASLPRLCTDYFGKT